MDAKVVAAEVTGSDYMAEPSWEGVSLRQQSADRGMMVVLVYSAGALLGLAGLAKLYSFSVEPMWAAKVPDPLFGFIARDRLLIAVGLTELLLGGLTMIGTIPIRIRGAALFWIASMLLLYRAGLWLVGATGPCHCSGVIPRLLGVRASSMDAVMLAMAMFIWMAGVSALLPTRKREVGA